ncbi:MAG: HAD family hydrolase [Actinomycetota bacterium]
MPSPADAVVIDAGTIHGVVFDTDGVMTDTASVHSAAWKEMFDELLTRRAQSSGEPFRPFEHEDYLRYVDGRPRYDGVRSFLRSRGIEVPEGDPSDPPDRETVCGLGNRKDQRFLEVIRKRGVRRFESSVALVEELRRRGVRVAVVSASRNMREVLDAAGIRDLFGATVDGVDSERLGLAGKPDPALFLEAARRIGVDPGEAAVVEDATAGVEAGRRGGFAMVIGVGRADDPEALLEHGADVVVADLAEVRVTGGRPRDAATPDSGP